MIADVTVIYAQLVGKGYGVMVETSCCLYMKHRFNVVLIPFMDSVHRDNILKDQGPLLLFLSQLVVLLYHRQ